MLRMSLVSYFLEQIILPSKMIVSQFKDGLRNTSEKYPFICVEFMIR